MSNILITGASGFIGQKITRALSSDDQVICLSRAKPQIDTEIEYIKGSFNRREDLEKLSRYSIDSAIHLAAVTAHGDADDILSVNVEGTRRFLSYILEQDCERIVLASSIAAVGSQSPKFKPQELPISDDHPCFARHPYGLSKYLMEEITRYMSRQYEEKVLVNIRLGGVYEQDSPPNPISASDPRPDEWTWNYFGHISDDDAIQAFTLAVKEPLKPGSHVMNAVGPDSGTEDPVSEVLESWYPGITDELDLSSYEGERCKRKPVFDIRRIKQKLGFEPQHSIVTE